MSIKVETMPVTDPRLGRQLVHDSRSRSFPAPLARFQPVEPFRHRFYQPRVTPNQPVGCCTGVAEAVIANSVPNRVKGRVLDMDDALACYRIASRNDPWPGEWEPEDTGSSGLAAAKGAVELGWAAGYEWCFGLDHVRSALPIRPISVGTWWPGSAFYLDEDGFIDCRGGYVGGHQWTLTGWHPEGDTFYGLCWWGPDWPTPGAKGRFKIRGADLNRLLEDDGDAHMTTPKFHIVAESGRGKYYLGG